MQTVVVVVATAEQAAVLNDALRDANNGDAFQAGLVPAGSKPGTAPTHYHSSWGEDQWQFLATLRTAGKLAEPQARLRTDRTTAKIADNGVLAFAAGDSFDFGKLLARLGLEPADASDPPLEVVAGDIDAVVRG